MSASSDARQASTVRPVTVVDERAFLDFIAQVPAGERRFLKEDLSDPVETFAGFVRDGAPVRLVAVTSTGELAGLAGVFPGEGWSAHVAELRVLVAGAQRGRGTGRALARAALREALEVGCSQVFVEVISEQEALVAMFQDLGFLPEALLPDFVRDGDGIFHDLMLLTHRVADHTGALRLLGLDEIAS